MYIVSPIEKKVYICTKDQNIADLSTDMTEAKRIHADYEHVISADDAFVITIKDSYIVDLATNKLYVVVDADIDDLDACMTDIKARIADNYHYPIMLKIVPQYQYITTYPETTDNNQPRIVHTQDYPSMPYIYPNQPWQGPNIVYCRSTESNGHITTDQK